MADKNLQPKLFWREKKFWREKTSGHFLLELEKRALVCLDWFLELA
jgi:hypothetical protein